MWWRDRLFHEATASRSIGWWYPGLKICLLSKIKKGQAATGLYI